MSRALPKSPFKQSAPMQREREYTDSDCSSDTEATFRNSDDIVGANDEIHPLSPKWKFWLWIGKCIFI